MDFNFDEGDFSVYNHAGHVKCSIQNNGKVDLISEKEGKIGLSELGMFNLMKGWIDAYHNMRPQYKEELIESLNKK